MPEGFSWTVSGATIVTVIGWLMTIGGFLWQRSRQETTLQVRVEAAHAKLDTIDAFGRQQKTAYDEHLRVLADDRAQWRATIEREFDERIEALKRSTDQQVAGCAASDRLLNEQLAEVRENLAKNYMTKPEIAEIERRVTSNQERIIGRMDKFDERLTDVAKTILEAIRLSRA